MSASRDPSKKISELPPGNSGTHIAAPNTYVLSQLPRVLPFTNRRTPFTPTADNYVANLQRLVHHEGNRAPNRKILFHLRLLTYYPPIPDLLPEFVTLLHSTNVHVCRLAHYFIRLLTPMKDMTVYRDIIEALELEVSSSSPARRAQAIKTLSRVFVPSDISRASDFITDAFNAIGGARVKPPSQPRQKRIAGVEIPRTQKKDTKYKRPLLQIPLISTKVVFGESYDDIEAKQNRRETRGNKMDDGTGGSMEKGYGNPEFIKSRFGKMLVGHSVFAALRRLNRVAVNDAKIESYMLDSGLMSVVPSTVRHCVALIEWRSTVAPAAVAKYILNRLPHRNPPAELRLHLQDLGSRVFFARIISSLAEDPNLSVYTQKDASKSRDAQRTQRPTLKSALDSSGVQNKAKGIFRFLFSRDLVSNVANNLKTTTKNAVTTRRPVVPKNQQVGVEFAEALINLLKNASNRVLIEALRGLSHRRWTTWFEAPIPEGALYNSPELEDGDAYGGTADAWGANDSDDDEEEEGEEELGAYEDDVIEEVGSPKSSNKEQTEPAKKNLEFQDLEGGEQNRGWIQRLQVKRQERRVARIDKQIPFYLRKVGQGMVPALEVVLRRIYGALLDDEPTRRFAAADAIIVLSRAKIYGHAAEDQKLLSLARSSIQNAMSGSSRALVTTEQSNLRPQQSFNNEEKHPFHSLVRPLAEIVHEDPNQFVRGRAATALLFVVACGAGRTFPDLDEIDTEIAQKEFERSEQVQKTPILLRYFRNFVTHESAGSGIGLKLVSELVDYMNHEILDLAPDLSASAIEMTELWAMTHPTVGVCGTLGAVWEKCLAIGKGESVGKSIFRAVNSKPHTERVASAAVVFLRRRTLDLAVITVGASLITGTALPEPLPRAVGVEMEKYFSLLWHAALLGPSAECRTFAVEALGGAAALAGEPFRCCTYERLVELVRMRGFGLKIPAEQVLNCLDVLYSCRQRFSEERAAKRIPRSGEYKALSWLQYVWKLGAEASSAAQILLGVPPPPGWLPLGPGAARDLANAEAKFGDVRLRENGEHKGAVIPSEVEVEAFDPLKHGAENGGEDLSATRASRRHNTDRARRNPKYPDDVDEYSSVGSGRSRRSFHDEDYPARPRRSNRSGNGSYGGSRHRSRSRSPRSFSARRSYGHAESDEYRNRNRNEREDESAVKRRQEQTDFELAQRLQKANTEEAERVSHGAGGSLPSALAGASSAAERLLKSGTKMTQRIVKSAGKAQVMGKIKNITKK